MSHFFTIVLVPERTPTDKIEAVVHELIAPYDERREVEPYTDEDGEESTYNPQSKWDWWRIGGRYNGVIQENCVNDNEGGFNFSPEFECPENNILHVRKIDHAVHCAALVTPDGTWHDRELFTNDPEELAAWDETIIKVIQENRNCLMVGIDCHI